MTRRSAPAQLGIGVVGAHGLSIEDRRFGFRGRAEDRFERPAAQFGMRPDRIEAGRSVTERVELALQGRVAGVANSDGGQLDAAAVQVLDLERTVGGRLAEQRLPVDLPGQLRAERVGDRRHHVIGAGEPVVDATGALLWQLHQSGTEKMSAAFVSVASRRSPPARKETPWSAVTTITRAS